LAASKISAVGRYSIFGGSGQIRERRYFALVPILLQKFEISGGDSSPTKWNVFLPTSIPIVLMVSGVF
jgi:hypothetical protein